MSLDVTQMETPALESAKQERYEKAKSIVDGVKARVGSDADAYESFSGDEQTKYKEFMADAQILETEIERRKDIDSMRKFGEKAGTPPTLAKMLGADGQPGEGAEGGGDGAPPMTPGMKFISSEIYRKHHAAGVFNYEPNSGNIPEFAVALDHKSRFGVHRRLMKAADAWEKALIHTGENVGGAFVVPEYQMDVEGLARPTPDILGLLPVQRTNTDTIYWMRQDTRSTAATTVSQASTLTGSEGLKPESSMAWSRQSTPVETIAVWVAATNQQLADAPEIRGLIDGELRGDLELQLDYQILQGDGAAPNIGGLLNAGIQTIGYSTGVGNIADNLLYASVAIMTANESEPTAAVLNPLQFFVLSTMKTAGSGEYINGLPTAAPSRNIWGYTMAVSNRMPAQTGVLGYFPAARLHMREDSSVKVGFAGDDFIHNRVRILAELRAALTVRRPNAFCRVTGLPNS